MRTTNGVNLQNSVSILFWVSHMILEKRKLNLLTSSVVCSSSCGCSASLIYWDFYTGKIRIGQNSLFKFYNGFWDLSKCYSRDLIFVYNSFYFTVSITPISLWFFTLLLNLLIIGSSELLSQLIYFSLYFLVLLLNSFLCLHHAATHESWSWQQICYTSFFYN